jgi:hypothetical protein
MLINKRPDIKLTDLTREVVELANLTHSYIVIPDVRHTTFRLPKSVLKLVVPSVVKLATLLRVRPIIEVHNEQIQMAGFNRGYKQSFRRLLNFATRAIEGGLRTDTIVIAYAGDFDRVHQSTTYQKLLTVATQHKVRIIETVLPLSGGVIFGARSIAIGIAQKNQKLKL